MSNGSTDEGVIQVLLERMNEQRLPRLLGLQKRVRQGERLSELDMQFLKEVFEDASRVGPLFDRHPEYQDLARKMVSLYHSITERALENERKGG